MDASEHSTETGRTIGLIIFIATEVMFFAGLLSSYWVIRAQLDAWPPLGQPRLPVAVTGLNSLILIGSAIAIAHARYDRKTSSSRTVSGWLGLAAFAGLIFLSIQGFEWIRMLHFGLTAVANIYGGFFYLVVGAHALHVVIALGILVFVTYRARQGHYTASCQTGLRLCRIYWIFVVALWPFIYVALYLV